MSVHAFLTLFAVAALNAQDQPVGKGVNLYSTEKEVALGTQLASDFRRTHASLDDAAARDYIEQMGARLVRALPQPPPFTYHFELTTDSSGTFLEPASLPGGYVFVPAGLILAAKDETELAGTLAHAIAHIATRHGTRQATRAAIAQQATIPLVFVGGSNGYGPSQGDNLLLPVGMLQFQRAFESEADMLAVGIALAAGYDPHGLASYVGRVQEDPQQASMSGFPRRDTRILRIEQAIQGLQAKTYTSSGEFAQIQEEVRRRQPPAPPNPTLQR
ncbi:MAG: M48 family metalloprotease [Bryobacterales bacterium]|nr:M48 family metalloprotease [Bryobacterales bacterium]MBV9399386.1 M48 family metalloprotease [Bryobacterales bacterium]